MRAVPDIAIVAQAQICSVRRWSLRCSRGSETANISRHVRGELLLARHPSDGKLKPIRDAALLCQGERRGLIAATAPPDEAHSGKGYAEKR